MRALGWIYRFILFGALGCAGFSSVLAEERAVAKPDTSTKTNTNTNTPTKTNTNTNTPTKTNTNTNTPTKVERSTEPARGRIEIGDSPTFRQLQKMEPSTKKQEKGFDNR